MNNKNTNLNKGFTIVETMVAVFVLTMALAALLTVTADSVFNARYAKNEITANYLLEEAADFIRNERDTIAFQNNSGGDWVSFLNKYGWGNGTAPDTCFLASGCYVDIIEPGAAPMLCTDAPSWGTSSCPIMGFNDADASKNFYNYTAGSDKSIFNREIKMKLDQTKNGGEELDVSIRIEWLNGNLVRSRTLNMSLLNWQ